MIVFDHQRVRTLRERAAYHPDRDDVPLLDGMIDACIDSLSHMKRYFPLVLDLGCRTGRLTERLLATEQIGKVICADMAPTMVKQAMTRTHQDGCVIDMGPLPFALGSMDAIISLLTLHTANYLPSLLQHMQQLLKPEGLIYITFLGPKTLHEWHHSFMAAEIEANLSVQPHIAPTMTIKDAAHLLQMAGFSPVITDCFTYHVIAPSLSLLHRDIQALGEGLALQQHPCHIIPRSVLKAMDHHYRSHYFDVPHGGYCMSIEVISCTALRAQITGSFLHDGIATA